MFAIVVNKWYLPHKLLRSEYRGVDERLVLQRERQSSTTQEIYIAG